PTNFFTYLYELPFTDSKFVSLISGLNYNKYMKYKLYETIYRVYYPNYLDEPWTIALGRKRNDLKELAGGLRGVELIENRINNKKRFNLFLNQNTILNKKNSDVINSKELCFLFNWMNIYKSVLDSSDIERLAGKSFLK
ncbi:MAG: hypothetical protein KAR31_11330, partial [Candidatus Omnitrophica bacterium]|nr:hypothetical protein [Candidatus Omnitrophota bacterium]